MWKILPHIRVKVINGFDQTDTSDLKQVIYIFIVIRKTFTVTLKTSRRFP